MKKIIAALFLLSLSTLGYATCDDMVERTKSVLVYKDNGNEKRSFASCKVWPDDSNKDVIALAHIPKNPASKTTIDGTGDLYDLDVLVVDSGNGKILSQLSQKGVLATDAIDLTAVAIDTARYFVAPELRAFGIMADYRSNSHAYSYNALTMNLYVVQGKQINQLFSNVIMEEETGSEAPVSDDCTYHQTQTKRILSMARTVTNGYADIIVQEKKLTSDSELLKKKCIVKKSTTKKQYTLRFNGDTYVVPKDIKYE